MTDTKLFKTTAFNKETGVAKVFFGLNHHKRAVEWLQSVTTKTHKVQLAF